MQSKERSSVQSVARTLDILEALSSADGDLSMSYLHEVTNLPLGTVHRLLSTLVARGYASQDSETHRYGPGPRLLEIASKALSNSRFSLRLIARDYLKQLTAATRETANLVVLQGDEIMYIDQVSSPQTVRMFTEIGSRAALYCTGAGKAILAAITPSELDIYLARISLQPWTRQTIITLEMLREEISRIQQRGFAIDNEEREEGVRCVAAAIYDHLGMCVGALSVSGPARRLGEDTLMALGPSVREAADKCSLKLGYIFKT